MAWWQLLIVVFLSVALGVILGILLNYLIFRLQGKEWPYFKRLRGTTEVQEQVASDGATSDPAAVFVAQQREIASAQIAQPLEKMEQRLSQETLEPVEKVTVRNVDGMQSGLFLEIESNLTVATAPWMGKLQPFATTLWDALPDKDGSLPAEFRDDLVQAYADIRVANGIVWLCDEMGRRSDALDDSYIKLCNKIADRLKAAARSRKDSGSYRNSTSPG